MANKSVVNKKLATLYSAIIYFLPLIINVNETNQEELDKKSNSNSTISYRSRSRDFEPTLIFSDSKHQRNIDEVNFFKLNNNNFL